MHEEQHLSFAGNNNFGSHLRLLDEAKKTIMMTLKVMQYSLNFSLQSLNITRS